MTPAARVAAAIEILDTILEGAPAERALTRWARARRFAGSKDRAAIRDHVFDALRNLRAYASLGGQAWPETTGRAVMIGAIRHQGVAMDDTFSGVGHAPPPLSDVENALPEPLSDADRRNMPDAVWALLDASLGAQADVAAQILTERAPITLRVNLQKISRVGAEERLLQEAIKAGPNPLSPSALTVTEGARKVQNSTAFLTGLVELQDASSQAVVDSLPLRAGQSVLDYCAGGGGKSLALAMRTGAVVFAHDVDAGRMRDVPARAARAGADIRLCSEMKSVPSADLVLVDAPCSGSGSWRRAAEAKWSFSNARLFELMQMQDDVLQQAAGHVTPGGVLAYATCSVFTDENDARVDAFLAAHPEWQCSHRETWPISAEGDGFYCAQLTRE